jgi:hypothetical protein
MSLGGDFDNQSVRSECFEWLDGALLLDGATAQFFEVAARDVGALTSLAGAEFAMGAVTVAADSTVTFRDLFDNDRAGQASCSEALYVGTLTLGANATVTLDHCRIYSERFILDPSVSIRCDCEPCISTHATGDANGDGLVQLSDWAAAAVCLSGPQAGVAYHCLVFDLYGDDHLDLRDAASMQRMIYP